MKNLKTRWKDKVGTLKTHLSKITAEELAQGSLKRVHSNDVGFFHVKST